MNSANKGGPSAVKKTASLLINLAAFFMFAVFALVMASIVGRMISVELRGATAYAGYCMAAASFLALADTLRQGDHIRVMLLLERLGKAKRRLFEIWCHAAGCFFCGALALFSIRLVVQSYQFNDVSQASDGTPLWIPEITMAVGTVVMFFAMLENFWLWLRNRAPVTGQDPSKPKATE